MSVYLPHIKSKVLLALCLLLLLIGCAKKEEPASQSISSSDLATLSQRQQKGSKLYYVMPSVLPLFVEVPSSEGAVAQVFLDQASTLRQLDTTIYPAANGLNYCYVEDVATGAKGYVAQDYIIDATYRIGVTLNHAMHYFQPDAALGGSNTIALPAYTLIFSNDLALERAVLPEFIYYYAVDPQGFPLEGYLKSALVSFDVSTLNAYKLYQQAFHSADFEQQRDFAQRLNRLGNENIFQPLMEALLNLRTFATFDQLPALFDRPYQAKRREQLAKHLVPLYAQPDEQSLVLGYISDERPLGLVAGYLFNEQLMDTQSPYLWYLVQHQGWVLSKNIEVLESVNEAHRLLEPNLAIEWDNEASLLALE